MKKNIIRLLSFLPVLSLLITLLIPLHASGASAKITSSQKSIMEALLRVYSMQHYDYDENTNKDTLTGGTISKESDINLCVMSLHFMAQCPRSMPESAKKWMQGTLAADQDGENFTKAQVEKASKELFGVSPKKHTAFDDFELSYNSSSGKYYAMVYEGEPSFTVDLVSYKTLKSGNISTTSIITVDYDSNFYSITAVFSPAKNSWGYTLNSVKYEKLAEWPTIYSNFLNSNSLYGVEFALLELGDDIIPELVLREEGEYGDYVVYTFGLKDGEMIFLGESEFAHEIYYYNNRLIDTYSGSGMDTWAAFRRENNKIIETDYLVAEKDDDTQKWSYSYLGKAVSSDKYYQIEKAIINAPDIEWYVW